MEKDLLKKIYNILIVICVVLVINTIILIFVNSSHESVSPNNNDTENSNYDVSKFKELSMQEVIDLFDEKGRYVVYLGRPDCSACIAFVPNLNTVRDDLDFDVYYYNTNNLSQDSSLIDTLANLLPQEATVDGETNTYGYFLGVTPMLFIIEDGKMKDGIIGAYDVTSLTTFLNENGIK